MNVRDGYKNTKLGWIPEEWDVVKMGSFTKPVSKKNIRGRVSTVVSVTKYDGIVDSLSYFKKQVYSEDTSTYKIICRNQFAYATIHLDEGSIGVLTSYEKAILSPMYTVFEADKGLVDLYFLLCLLKSKRMMNIYRHIGSGSINRRKSISYSTFSKIDLSLPPLFEQKKIAEILNTVDYKISLIENRIQQTEQLKKGLMEKLLTDGIGHTAFKGTKIGRIPASWKIKPLDAIGEFMKGKGIAKKDLLDEGIPCVRYGEIYTVHHGVIKKFYSFIDSKTAGQSFEIQKNDILFAGSGETVDEIGKAILYLGDAPAYAGGDTIVLRPQNNIHSAFLSAYLNSSEAIRQKRKMGQGNSVVHIYARDLKTLIVPCPPLGEQKKIASILSTVDDQLDLLQSKKIKYEVLKNGLMEQLLTGKRRVKV
jgi:type I restriction enzyme S subunit